MDVISLTRRLLAIKTMNPPGQERACARFLGRLLEKAGFKIWYWDFAEGRTGLIAWTKRPERHHICFLGHLDTVPLGTTPWSRDPFSGRIEGDKLYGLGAADMKAGVAAFVSAAVRARRAIQGHAGIMLILTAGEETGCEGATFLVHILGGLPPVGALIVAEPTANYPCTAHKGVIWLEASASGVAAHGSAPHHGVNAIYKAIQAIARLQNMTFATPSHPLLGMPTINIGTITAGTAVNIVPENAMFTIDIRTIPGQSHSAVCRQVEDCLGTEARISKRRLDCPAIESDPSHPWIQDVFAVMEPILAARPACPSSAREPHGMAYFTDASVLRAALGNPPAIILGPGDPAQVHKPDEFCLASNIEAAERAYYQIIMKWSRP
ncbi:MAG: M20 family metallopeptidase [Lentisphaerae bacterium]|nr:M20 family metallopeptidase [Lentisphaerota bacterium]